jgi:ADP-heptose:LPS heptosyltransferase
MSQPVHIGFLKIITSIGSWKIKTIKLMDYIFGTLIAFVIIPRKKTSPPKIINKILIIRPGGVGDAIFLLPILKSLKQQYPSLTIDILCESRNIEGFISQQDCYNRLFCYNHFNELKTILRQSYDIVVDTEQWHFFSALVSFFINTQYRIGFNTRPLRSKLFEETHAYSHDRYELENFKILFGNLISQSIPNSIDHCFSLNENVKRWAQTKIPENVVSLFLGGSISLRRFTKQQTLDIINALLKRNFSVALLGGKDVEKAAAIIQQDANHSSIYNFSGKVSLEESAALIQRSRLFIGTDSGLMHVACAVGTQVIGIFGPGNIKKWGPRGKQDTIINLNISDSPYTFFGYTNIPSDKNCFRELKVETILKTIQ